MRFVRVMFVALGALAIGACDVPPEQRARDVCTAVCDCFYSGQSSKIAACIDQCIPQNPTVSDDCLTCVYENSAQCTTLLTDCDNLCSSQQPTP